MTERGLPPYLPKPKATDRMGIILQEFGNLGFLPKPRIHREWPTKFDTVRYDYRDHTAHLETPTLVVDLKKIGKNTILSRDIERPSVGRRSRSANVVRVRLTDKRTSFDYTLNDFYQSKDQMVTPEFANIEVSRHFETRRYNADVIFASALYRGGSLASIYLAESSPSADEIDHYEILSRKLNSQASPNAALFYLPGAYISRENDNTGFEYRNPLGESGYVEHIGDDFTYKNIFRVFNNGILTTLSRVGLDLPWSFTVPNAVDTKKMLEFAKGDIDRCAQLPHLLDVQANFSGRV